MNEVGLTKDEVEEFISLQLKIVEDITSIESYSKLSFLTEVLNLCSSTMSILELDLVDW